MRLSALLCAAGVTTVAAFAPIGSQSGVSSSGLRAAENNFEDAPVVATFDPLNLATEEPASGKSGSAMSIAAATTAAWVASADVASANNSPDWGVFEGVSFHMCFVPNAILDLYAGLCHACVYRLPFEFHSHLLRSCFISGPIGGWYRSHLGSAACCAICDLGIFLRCYNAKL